MKLVALAASLAALVAFPAAASASPEAGEAPVLSAESTAAEVLAAARAMLPARPVELSGAIVLRNRRGIPMAEYSYTLEMRRNEEPSRLCVEIRSRKSGEKRLSATILRSRGGRVSIETRDADGKTGSPDLRDAILGTDVTWLDLTLDFLWWNDAEYEAERESESIHGQKCVVILVKAPAPGEPPIRIWADRKTGCLMQAHELDAAGNPVRRLWGTRIKKFDGRWSVSVIETERPGSGHRTKITVESMKNK